MNPTRPDAGTNLSPHVHHPTSQLTSPGMGGSPLQLKTLPEREHGTY